MRRLDIEEGNDIEGGKELRVRDQQTEFGMRGREQRKDKQELEFREQKMKKMELSLNVRF